MDELVAQFRLEGPELVQRACDDLLALERAPGDRDRLDGAFRAVHTLKGSVALFDMAPLGQALHAAEDWLGAVRAGLQPLDAARVEALLGLLGDSEAWIAGFGEEAGLPPHAVQACTAATLRLTAAAAAASQAPSSDETSDAAPDWADAFVAAHADALQGDAPRALVRYTPDPDCFFRGEDPLALMARLPGLLALDLAPREPWPAAVQYDPFRCNLVLTALAETAVETAREVFRLAGKAVEVRVVKAPPAGRPASPDAGEPAAAARRLRIEPARVDALLDLATDLVGVNASLGRIQGEGPQGRDLAVLQQRLDRLTGELHGAVMRLRLAPLSRTFERLPRLVRELAGRLAKPVALRIEGGEAEADRTVVDGLFEPLLHLIRNSLDHGVEDPAARTAAGKPVEATLQVSARAQGGELVIEVRDDGRGVDLDAVRRRAVKRGLLDAGRAEGLTPEAAIELLFAPGFSTAASVSEVSGRGVGLDSVRDALEALGGRVSLASQAGRGTVATLRAPLSASLMRLLLMEVGGETYGAPLSAVAETARTPRERVQAVGAGEAVVWRDQALPVVWLHDRLGLPRPAVEGELRLLIGGEGEGRTAFVADGFLGRASGVLRPLPPLLSDLPGLLGTTLHGDEVIFVLDLQELAR